MAAPAAEYGNFFKRLAGLPPFPATAVRLLTLSAESATAVQEFENAFKADPALATDLLQMANSAEFGLRARVDNVKHAVTLLGLDRVNSLSVTIAMRMCVRGAALPRVTQSLWLHGIATAVIAEALAKVLGLSADGLYTAGLVHDVGRLGCLMCAGPLYAKMLVPPVLTVEDANARERETFGIDHAEAGATMVQAWGFPAPLCMAIRDHHRETELPDEKLRPVRLACRLAGALGYGEHAGLIRPAIGNVVADLPAVLRGAPSLQPERLLLRITNVLRSLSALR